MFEVMIRASAERSTSGTAPFTYAIILTKSDRAAQKAVTASINDIREETRAIIAALGADDDQRVFSSSLEGVDEDEGDDPRTIVGGSSAAAADGAAAVKQVQQQLADIPILVTSSSAKQGADDVWKLLQQVVTGKSYEDQTVDLTEKLQQLQQQQLQQQPRSERFSNGAAAVNSVADAVKERTRTASGRSPSPKEVKINTKATIKKAKSVEDSDESNPIKPIMDRARKTPTKRSLKSKNLRRT